MLLTTKFFIPPIRAAHVSRPRLLDKLASSAHARLLLISAPAGFGKTTLAAEWIRNLRQGDKETQRQADVGSPFPIISLPSPHPVSASPPPAVAWLSLDEDDNDPVRFVTYLVAALQSIDESMGRGLLAVLSASPSPDLAALITGLVNDMAAVAKPFVLVFDDYHVIDAADIHQAMTFLIDQMPAAMQLVLTSRTDPPLPLARWRVRRALVELRAADLRFTQAEAAEFLHKELGAPLPDDAVTALEQRTEGWITGLHLAALSMQEPHERDSFIQQFTGSYHYIIDYLTDEVLQRQPPPVQSFLRQTAILERLCGPLCDVVTARNDSQALLERLQRANLFITALDHERRWFRYHHLFADVLRKGVNPDQTQPIQLLHWRAAQWYEEQGMISDAIRHALAAGEALYAGRLIQQNAEQWRHHGEFVTLTKLLDQLPPETVLALPSLCLERAISYMFYHQLNEAEEWLERAEQGSSAEPLERTLRGRIAAVRLDIALNRSALPEAIHWAEQALADLPLTDQRTRSTVIFLLGIAHLWRGQPEQAQEAYLEAVRLGVQSGAIQITIYALAAETQLWQRWGVWRRALASVQRAFDYAREMGVQETPILASSYVHMGEILYELNDLPAAEAHLRKGLALAQQARNPRTQLHAYSSLLHLVGSQQREADLQEIVQTAQSLLQTFPLPPPMVNDL
jgi:LuxR family maltose regulon positive regulatory protein